MSNSFLVEILFYEDYQSFLNKIKQKSLRNIIDGIVTRLLYIYPLKLLSPIFNLFLFSFLIVISCCRKVKVSFLVTERIGHLATNTDLFLRLRQLDTLPKGISYIFFAGTPCNRQLLKMWKRHLFIIENQLIYDLFRYSEKWWYKTSYFEPLLTFFNEYSVYHRTKNTLKFNNDEYELGYKKLKEMGIDLRQDWYVCIYARDSEYLNTVYPKGNWSYHDYRNSDINNFKKVSEYITDLGGYIIRLGSHVNKPFEMENQNVIDYASNYRSDFMDIFLVANCKFLMGNTSGICDVTMAFDVPYLGLNIAPIGNVPHGRNGLFIPKKIKSRKTGEFILISKVILETKTRNEKFWSSNWWYEQEYELIENTDEEILEVAKEMIDRLNGDFSLTKEESELLQYYFDLYSEDHWAREIKTPIGLDFLKKNQELFA